MPECSYALSAHPQQLYFADSVHIPDIMRIGGLCGVERAGRKIPVESIDCMRYNKTKYGMLYSDAACPGDTRLVPTHAKGGMAVRKHTIIGLILLAVSLTAMILVLMLHGSAPARLDALMVDDAQLEALKKHRQEDTTLLQELFANDFSLPRASDTWYYSMVEQDAQADSPVLQAAGHSGLQLAFAQTTVDDAFLRSGDGIAFVAYTDDAYATGVLQLTTLPVLRIDVTKPDANGSYAVTDRTERAAVMRLLDNRSGLTDQARLVRSDATIRIRDASSVYQPKYSYRLSLSMESLGGNTRPNHIPLLGLREDEDWILYAAGGDQERLRNAFSNNLWYDTCASDNCMGVTLGVQATFVELILNGEYMGLYTLMHPLDDKQLQLSSDDFYYRGISYDLTTSQMMQDAADEQTVVGGWEFRGPKDSTAVGYERWKPLEEYLWIYYNSDTQNFYKWMLETSDPDNMIRMYLFLSLVQGMDNFYKNSNLIVYTQPDGSHRCLFAPWDLDLTWGNSYTLDNEWRTLPYSLPPDLIYGHRLVDRMAGMSGAYCEQILQTWQQLRTGPWSDEAMLAQLDGYEA